LSSQCSSAKDRVYTKSADVPEIWDAGLDLFLKHIIRPPIKEHLVSAILKLVHIERNGYSINQSSVKGCVQVFLWLTVDREGLTVYKRDLESEVLRESAEYYKAEGERLLVSCDAPDYLRNVSASHRFHRLRIMGFRPKHVSTLKKLEQITTYRHRQLHHSVKSWKTTFLPLIYPI
jgi:hypothetical protein